MFLTVLQLQFGAICNKLQKKRYAKTNFSLVKLIASDAAVNE